MKDLTTSSSNSCLFTAILSLTSFDLLTSNYCKVRSLFKDGKQTAGCTEFRTETGLCSLVSVQKLEHSAVCLPTLKRERSLVPSMLLPRLKKKRYTYSVASIKTNVHNSLKKDKIGFWKLEGLEFGSEQISIFGEEVFKQHRVYSTSEMKKSSW